MGWRLRRKIEELQDGAHWEMMAAATTAATACMWKVGVAAASESGMAGEWSTTRNATRPAPLRSASLGTGVKSCPRAIGFF